MYQLPEWRQPHTFLLNILYRILDRFTWRDSIENETNPTETCQFGIRVYFSIFAITKLTSYA